ncbi:MAG: hypothetical protein AB1425_13930 [Actinomycetota bacterium]
MRSTSPRSWQAERRDDLSLYETAYLLWGRRRLIGGVVAALVLVAGGVALILGPSYSAQAVVGITPREEIGEDPQTFADEVLLFVTKGDEFKREAARRAGWEGSLQEFKERLTVSSFATQEGGPGITVRFEGTDPVEAARAANAYARHFVERVDELSESRLAGGSLAADAQLRQEAVPPERGHVLRFLAYAAAAIGMGFLIGGFAALILESRTNLWRDARDAEMTLRAPVLGVIPDYSAEEPR